MQVSKRISEYFFLWTLGGIIYYDCEILFRGFSHWSMFLLGGSCMLFFAQQGIWTQWNAPLWKQTMWCVIFVSGGEFITGMIVNKFFHWNVWDYSDQPFQLFGQICLSYTILFSGLCVIGILLSGFLLHFLYLEKSPHFHVL